MATKNVSRHIGWFLESWWEDINDLGFLWSILVGTQLFFILLPAPPNPSGWLIVLFIGVATLAYCARVMLVIAHGRLKVLFVSLSLILVLPIVYPLIVQRAFYTVSDFVLLSVLILISDGVYALITYIRIEYAIRKLG